MSRIRGRGNKETELALAKLLRAHGITGWRRNQEVFGKPDFVFLRQRPASAKGKLRRAKVAVFVDGCFWHACPKHATMPASNRAFWEKKLMGNKARDRVVNRALRREGWRVVRVWEHELTKNPQRCVEKIREALRRQS